MNRPESFYQKFGNFVWTTVAIFFVLRALVVALSLTIVRRRRAEEARRESEAFRKRVFESSPTPIVVMDAATFKYVDCNLAAIKIYGFASRE